MSVVLVCDLGSTNFRTALVDPAGTCVAACVTASPRPCNLAGSSEIDPGAWWSSFADGCTHLAQAEPDAFNAIEAIAICGVTRSQVFLAADGTPVRPAMTWNDTRAGGKACRMVEAWSGRHPELAHLNASHPLARLAWLREVEPATVARLSHLLEPKDYLNFRLTGRTASDPMSMARLLASAQPAGTFDLWQALGLSRAVLPAIVEPWAIMGTVQAGLPQPFDRLAGRPVLCGAHDTWMAVVGLGALQPGLAYNISGTTEVFGVLGHAAAIVEGLLTVDWRGLYQIGGPSQTGADTITWLHNLAGGDTAPLSETLANLLAAPRDFQPLLFLPYLQGERVPYWDPELRGAFIGLHRRHGMTDLAWAVLEGVGFLNRVVLERAEAALGRPVTEIRFGGGAAVNPVWCQIKADICGRPVVVGAAPQPGMLGAAIVAWTALGRFATLAEAQEELVESSARYEPDPGRMAIYTQMYNLFRQGEQALAPISHGLVRLAADALLPPTEQS